MPVPRHEGQHSDRVVVDLLDHHMVTSWRTEAAAAAAAAVVAAVVAAEAEYTAQLIRQVVCRARWPRQIARME